MKGDRLCVSKTEWILKIKGTYPGTELVCLTQFPNLVNNNENETLTFFFLYQEKEPRGEEKRYAERKSTKLGWRLEDSVACKRSSVWKGLVARKAI